MDTWMLFIYTDALQVLFKFKILAKFSLAQQMNFAVQPFKHDNNAILNFSYEKNTFSFEIVYRA